MFPLGFLSRRFVGKPIELLLSVPRKIGYTLNVYIWYCLKNSPSYSCLETRVIRYDTLQLPYQASCGSGTKGTAGFLQAQTFANCRQKIPKPGGWLLTKETELHTGLSILLSLLGRPASQEKLQHTSLSYKNQ